MAREPRPCARCGEVRIIRGRELCNTCYCALRGTPELALYDVRRPSRVNLRTVDCVHCGEHAPHCGRGLCKVCYHSLKYRGELDEYPTTDPFEVDEVVVDRAVQWVIKIAGTLPRPERRRIQGTTRPTLTRGEKIEVLRRTCHDVPRAVALEALGVSGRLYRPLAREAGLIR